MSSTIRLSPTTYFTKTATSVYPLHVNTIPPLLRAGGREFNPRPGQYSRMSISSDQVTGKVFSSEHAFPSKFWIYLKHCPRGETKYRPSAPCYNQKCSHARKCSQKNLTRNVANFVGGYIFGEPHTQKCSRAWKCSRHWPNRKCSHIVRKCSRGWPNRKCSHIARKCSRYKIVRLTTWTKLYLLFWTSHFYY